MWESDRSICPIPYQGYCVYQRCNFWDEERQECNGLCLGEYTPLETSGLVLSESPCIIHWTEDND